MGPTSRLNQYQEESSKNTLPSKSNCISSNIPEKKIPSSLKNSFAKLVSPLQLRFSQLNRGERIKEIFHLLCSLFKFLCANDFFDLTQKKEKRCFYLTVISLKTEKTTTS